MSTQSKQPKLAVIDYGMGNLRSVVKAWQAVGANAYLIQKPEEADDAHALVFPGQVQSSTPCSYYQRLDSIN